jgi:hypothetical protein
MFAERRAAALAARGEMPSALSRGFSPSSAAASIAG